MLGRVRYQNAILLILLQKRMLQETMASIESYASHSKMPKDVSPPVSPGIIDSGSYFPNLTPLPMKGTDSNCMSIEQTGSSVTNDYSPAIQAVCEMGIPQQLVQLVIDARQLENGAPFQNVSELFNEAFDIANNFDKQVELSDKLHKAQEKHKSNSKHEKTHSSTYVKEAVKSEFNALQDLGASAAMSAASQPGKANLCKTEQQKKVLALMVENRQLKDKKLCRACKKVELAVSGITFLPCGHFITCEKCADSFEDCPACGKNIMGTVRTYLS